MQALRVVVVWKGGCEFAVVALGQTTDALVEVLDHLSGTDLEGHVLPAATLERFLVDLASGCEVRKVVGEPTVAAVDAGTQAPDETFFFFGLFLFPKHGFTIL